jgi:type I restriction enzyme, S subunit
MSDLATPDWRELPFGGLCARIVNGGTPATDNARYWGGHIPWVTGADFTSKGIGEIRRYVTEAGVRSSATSVVKAGNLLVVTRTGVGKLAIAPFDIAISQDITGVYLDETQVDTCFAFHLLFREIEDLKKLNQGTSINGIVRSDLERHKVSLPVDTSQQRQIAAVLSRVDSAIEASEALIEKHQQIKAGLIHDLFTRGVLVSGELRQQMNAAPGLYREGAAGVIPAEWDVATAGSLCSLVTKGTTPAAADMWEGDEGIRFLRVDNLTFDGQLSFGASEFRISPFTPASTLARSRCAAGDVLMNIVGPPLGKVGLVSEEDGSININQAIAVFRPGGRVLSRFLLLWLTTDTAKRWILQRGKQTSGQVNVTLAMCQALPVPLPTLEEQSRIVARISASDSTLRLLAMRLEKVRAQKIGLMQDLLTGKVTVKVPEPAIPA